MPEQTREFVSAAGHSWFLPLYDPLTWLMGGRAALGALLDQAGLRPGQRVLDVGCGTGTLATMVMQRCRELEVTGLDPDAGALARAQRKAQRAGVAIQLDQGFGDHLPYADASFDRVLSSLMFHHLDADEKAATLREIRRVLKPGGSLHLLDFEGPEGASEGVLTRVLHSSRRLRDNAEAHVLALLGQAGFATAKKTGRRKLLVGRVATFEAGV